MQLKLFQLTQLQQTSALRFCSSVLAVTESSDFQFSKFYNLNRSLDRA